MNTYKLDSIRINFRKAMPIVVPAEYVSTFNFNDIKTSLVRAFNVEKVYKNDEARYVYMTLRPGEEWDSEIMFTRILNSKDINDIELLYQDGTKDDIFVHWNEGDSQENKYQSSMIMPNGQLMLVVDENRVKVSND